MPNEKKDFCAGVGSRESIKLINDSWKMIEGINDRPGLRSLADSDIKAFWQGGKWKGIWSQNYMGMYSWTPFLDDELLLFHDNAYNHFFALQGDGHRKDKAGMTAPAGALPEHVFFGNDKIPCPHYKNDEHTGKASEYDFWIEGTCGTIIGKSDILLRKHDRKEAKKYLPMIELALEWLESLRDKSNNLIKAGPAATFIERAYSGTDMGNGKFSYGFPAGVMIYYMKALTNAIELEVLVGNNKKAGIFRKRLKASEDGIAKLIENNNYFISYLDRKGIRHGVYGAKKHGYFESNPNHDAIAYRISGDALSENIYSTISSIPGLRQGKTISCVYPSRDDVLPGYQSDPAYGPGPGYHWHGASWFSSEARMLMAYYRLNKFNDVKNSLGRMFELYSKGFARDVMDNFGTEFPGSYNPEEKGVAYIDGFAVYGAGLRGLFEYQYMSDELILYPHVFDDISEYAQNMPVYFGKKKIYPSILNTGKPAISSVKLNGVPIASFSEKAVNLRYDIIPENAKLEIIK
ncbi:MAG: hypothetical protein A2017_14045 [Lentisphaerae bacterium GWF2_44_16]|nr:MAG: hypothetical protein A2017_14045 [Lentisphaerae bacterium GWF2_44_16]